LCPKTKEWPLVLAFPSGIHRLKLEGTSWEKLVDLCKILPILLCPRKICKYKVNIRSMFYICSLLVLWEGGEFDWGDVHPN
jgi:hypothetical protein